MVAQIFMELLKLMKMTGLNGFIQRVGRPWPEGLPITSFIEAEGPAGPLLAGVLTAQSAQNDCPGMSFPQGG